MENIYLVGSEDVSRAGANINEAADTINRAANNIDCSIIGFENFMNDWLTRFEQVLKENKQ